MDSFLVLGILGMACILVAFLLEQRGVWKNDDLRYDLVNFIGSLFLVIYAIDGRSWPFIVLNAVWGLYSLRDVWVDLRRPYERKRPWMFWRKR